MDADKIEPFEELYDGYWLILLDRTAFVTNDRLCQSCTDRYATVGDGQVAPDGCNEYSFLEGFDYSSDLDPQYQATLNMTKMQNLNYPQIFGCITFNPKFHGHTYPAYN